MMEDLLNVMRREANRVDARATTWAVGTIDGYDKKTHSAKVKLQPEGVLSGWLPLNAIGVGNGFGIKAAPKIGDPVLVHFHEGDREAGIVLGRFFTDKHAPVELEEGEYLLQHETKTKIFFKQDGTLYLVSKDGKAIVQFDPDGTLWLKRGDAFVKLTTDDKVAVKAVQVWLGGDVGDGQKVVTVVGPSANVYAKV